MLSLNDYQHAALKTARYLGQDTYIGLSYVNAKLNGEAGEFSEHVGKILRDDLVEMAAGVQVKPGENPLLIVISAPLPPILRATRREAMLKELGDILWYVAAAARELGYDFEEVARANLNKLADRAARGVIGGSGSDR